MVRRYGSRLRMASKCGDPATTFALAVSYGANSVELFANYAKLITLDVLEEYQAKLIANPKS
jgi:hypothetical protein